ncbi:cobalamin biosynthesis protein CobW [Fischerella thermalis CCMEE 5198]|uniref:CobW family GTP-binding protein n=1 Tax=Fischerella thermalis TaxID=372787 RepID=UPI000C8107F2|nr:GTP-binding protein [Fischerella thermalis]PMB02403.1 cobalamin biosynthesis protein CobW [Fischerella thermalis CCMEE 5196]PMB24308.1 cobalamin biosynthesis protein CobW [Fischerella thermalis CCMEE 5198]
MTGTIHETTLASFELPKRGMPVTIITGFLGSGKTTLLNQILSNRQDLKVAVLVNEFGDINIDSQLLVAMDEDMVELSNGCICCTINDGLVDAVYNVLERDDRVDYMLIETTGVADPLPIILTFLGTELRDLTRLDSIVTVVDSEAFTPDHFDSEAAFKQIAYGDVTILNKTDLADPDQIKNLEAYIHTVKEGARILHSQHGKVPLPLILDVGYNNPEAYANLVQEEIEQTQQDHLYKADHHDHDHHAHDDPHDHTHHPHEHHHHHSAHLDNDGFVSVAFESDRPFDVHKFESFLQEQLPKDVFRAKGILWFAQSDLRNVFQLSGPRFDLQGEAWRTPPKTQMVLIGRNLNADELRQQLTACIA